MIATPQMALEAAAAVAREAGFTPLHPRRRASRAKRAMSARCWPASRCRWRDTASPSRRPACCCPAARPRSPCAARAAAGATSSSCCRWRVALDGEPGIHALAGDTDGVDGQEEIAGALLAPDTLPRAWALGIRPRERLDDNDGHGFFEALGDSVVTGPTLTNVNDFRAIVIDGPANRSLTHAHVPCNAKIVATLGPASADRATIEALFMPAPMSSA